MEETFEWTVFFFSRVKLAIDSIVSDGTSFYSLEKLVSLITCFRRIVFFSPVMQFSALSCHVYFDRLTELSVMQIACCVSVLTTIDPLLGSPYIFSYFSRFCSRWWIAPIRVVCENLLAETTSCSPGSLEIKACPCFATISSAYRLWSSMIVGVAKVVTIYLCIWCNFSFAWLQSLLEGHCLFLFTSEVLNPV